MNSPQNRSAFTLIELLLVIGIIAILASIVIVAINPTKQLADARDTQRRSDVNTISNAIYQYTIDTGSLPVGIPIGEENAIEVCRMGQPDCSGYLDLDVLGGTYITTIPEDPQVLTEDVGTYYALYKDENNRLTVFAITPEQAETISVTR